MLKCYKSRIRKDYSRFFQEDVICPGCGNRIGRDEGNFIRMKQNAFVAGGTRQK